MLYAHLILAGGGWCGGPLESQRILVVRPGSPPDKDQGKFKQIMADDIKVWYHGSLQPERADKPILIDLRKRLFFRILEVKGGKIMESVI